MFEGGFLSKPWVAIPLFILALSLVAWTIFGGTSSDENEENIVTKQEAIAVDALKKLGVQPSKMKAYGKVFWTVDLSKKELTDEMLESLKYLKPVGNLDLSNTSITDTQLSFVSDIGVVGILNLSNTGISDTGLKELERLEFITNLDLSDTKVTQAGVEQFKNARPKDATLPVPEEQKSKAPKTLQSLIVKF